MVRQDKKVLALPSKIDQRILLRILDQMSEGILFVDPNGRVVFCNEAGRVLRRGLSGKDVCNNIYDCHKPDKRLRVLEILTDLATQPDRRHVEVVEVKERFFEFVYSGIFDDEGRHFGTLAVSRDVTERVTYESQLKELAAIDGLTRLFNRRYFYERLGEEIARAERQNHPLSLALLDVDKFKEINDTLGHQEGDRILSEVAKVLRSSVRTGVDTICRYGGDEFTIILPEATRDVAANVVDRLSIQVKEKIKPPVSVSVGLAILQLGVDSEELIRRADTAMYEAKRKRTGFFVHEG